MEYPEVLAGVVEILTPLAKGRSVTEDAALVGGLALDSLRIMNMVMSIEDRFDISMPVNVLADVKTVRDLALRVQTRVNAA